MLKQLKVSERAKVRKKNHRRSDSLGWLRVQGIGWAKFPFPDLLGLVRFVPTVAYHICLNLPEPFSQPGNGTSPALYYNLNDFCADNRIKVFQFVIEMQSLLLN